MARKRKPRPTSQHPTKSTVTPRALTSRGNDSRSARGLSGFVVHTGSDIQSTPSTITTSTGKVYKGYRPPDFTKVGAKRRHVIRFNEAVEWDSVWGMSVAASELRDIATPGQDVIHPGFENIHAKIPWPKLEALPARSAKWAAFTAGTVMPRSEMPQSHVEAVLGADNFFLPVPVVLEPKGRRFRVVNPYWSERGQTPASVRDYFATFDQKATVVLNEMVAEWDLIRTPQDFIDFTNQFRTFKSKDNRDVIIPYAFWLTPVETPSGQKMPRFVAASWQFRFADNRDYKNDEMSIYLGPVIEDMTKTFLTGSAPRELEKHRRSVEMKKETLVRPILDQIRAINRSEVNGFTAQSFTTQIGMMMDKNLMAESTWEDIRSLPGGSRELSMFGVRLQLEEMPHTLKQIYSSVDKHGNRHPDLGSLQTMMGQIGGEEKIRMASLFDKKLKNLVSPYMDTNPDRALAEAGLDFHHRVGLKIDQETIIAKSPELIPAFSIDAQDQMLQTKQDMTVGILSIGERGVGLAERVATAKAREARGAQGAVVGRLVPKLPIGQDLVRDPSTGARIDFSATQGGTARKGFEAPSQFWDLQVKQALTDLHAREIDNMALAPGLDYGDKKQYRNYTEYIGDVITDTPRIREDWTTDVKGAQEREFNTRYGPMFRDFTSEEFRAAREQWVSSSLTMDPAPTVLDVAIKKLKGLGPAAWTKGAGGIIVFGANMDWWDKETARQINEMILSQRTVEMGSNVALGTLRTFAIIRKNQEFLQRRKEYMEAADNAGWNRATAYTGQAFSLAGGFTAAHGQEDLAGGLGAAGGALQGYAALRPFGRNFGIGGGLLMGALGFFANRFRGRKVKLAKEERAARIERRRAERATFEAERGRIRAIREADFASRTLRMESRTLAVRIARGQSTRNDARQLSRYFRRPQFDSSMGLVGDVERRASKQFRPRF